MPSVFLTHLLANELNNNLFLFYQRDEYGRVVATPRKQGEKRKQEDPNVVNPGTSTSPQKKSASYFPCQRCTEITKATSRDHLSLHFGGFAKGPILRMSNLVWQDLGISPQEYEDRVRSDVQLVVQFTHQLNLRVIR